MASEHQVPEQAPSPAEIPRSGQPPEERPAGRENAAAAPAPRRRAGKVIALILRTARADQRLRWIPLSFLLAFAGLLLGSLLYGLLRTWRYNPLVELLPYERRAVEHLQRSDFTEAVQEIQEARRHLARLEPLLKEGAQKEAAPRWRWRLAAWETALRQAISVPDRELFYGCLEVRSGDFVRLRYTFPVENDDPRLDELSRVPQWQDFLGKRATMSLPEGGTLRGIAPMSCSRVAFTGDLAVRCTFRLLAGTFAQVMLYYHQDERTGLGAILTTTGLVRPVLIRRGRSYDLAPGTPAVIARKQAHRLRLQLKGRRFTCDLDEQQVLAVKVPELWPPDPSYRPSPVPSPISEGEGPVFEGGVAFLGQEDGVFFNDITLAGAVPESWKEAKRDSWRKLHRARIIEKLLHTLPIGEDHPPPGIAPDRLAPED